MFDLGSSSSFVSWDVFDKTKELELPHTIKTTEEFCQTVNGGSCNVMQVVALTVEVCFFFHGRLDSQSSISSPSLHFGG
jgi:hypothetical protein